MLVKKKRGVRAGTRHSAQIEPDLVRGRSES